MSRCFVAAGLILFSFVARNVDAADSLQGSPLINKYADLPLSFQAGRGGTPDAYIARGQGYQIALGGADLTIGVQSSKTLPASTIRMQFLGGHRSAGLPEGLLPGKVNYIIGKDPKKWDLGLPTYERVRYSNLYPGVDVVYYGNQQQLEFDLDVRPGAKPEAIRLKFDGAQKVTVDAAGSIVLQRPGGELRLNPPVVYQEIAGKRQKVRGTYRMLANGEVAFAVGSFDHTKNLVIDPTIVYSTFIGGGSSYTYPQAIALDSNNNAIIAGYTYAADFPTVSAASSAYHGNSDGFVSKMNSSGTALFYSTYIGGSGYDEFFGIAVDGAGNAWIAGQTNSTDFPTMSPTQGASGGGEDAVVVKLSSSGTLLFSTYLGGSNTDSGRGVALDGSGNAYVTGYASTGFPTTSGVISTSNQGSFDAFAVKYSSSGALVYSTFLGGSSTDYGYAISADGSGNAYVTGITYSSTFTGANGSGAQPTNGGGGDAFVLKLNPAANGLSYFTFLGGSQYDVGTRIVADSSGNAYVAGETSSSNLPIVSAFQPSLNGSTNGFAAKLNPAGTAFLYETYIGGNRTDSLNGLALEVGSGSVYLAGSTDSSAFPTINGIQTALPGTSSSALFQTLNSGSTWAAFDNGTLLRGTINSVSPDPTSSTVVVSTDVGLFKTTNSGSSWTQQSTINSVGLSRSPVTTSTIYAVSGSSAYKSTDSGNTWALTGSIGQCCSYDVVADPVTATTVYAFYQNYGLGVVKSTDGGVTWNPINTGLPSLTVQSMVAAGSSLYVALQSNGVYKSTNQGGTWTAVNSGLPGSFSPNTIVASGSSVLYVSDSSNIYQTSNGGTSWALIPTPVPNGSVATIGVSPQNTQVLYAASLFTPVVYQSTDGGTTWNPSSSGLGNATPSQLVFSQTSGQVFALTAVSTTSWVAKLNAAGTALVYSTFLGGSGGGYFGTVATDQAQNAFVTGYTYSSDFPISANAYSSTYLGNGQGFITKISDTTSACSFSVNPGNQLVYGAEQDIAFNVVSASGCSWTATSNQSWATIEAGASGIGVGDVAVQVSANSTGSSRSATLTIASQSITLNQASNGCTYSLNYSAAVAVSGGVVPVQLTTGATCDWSVLNDAPSAITVTGATTPGPGTINLNVAANPSPATRTLNVYIANTYVSLTQAGTMSGCSFNVSTPGTAPAAGGLVTVTVTTTSGCTWTSSSSLPWASISGSPGTTGSGSVTFSLQANPGPGSRTGSVIVAGQTVTLNQSGPAKSNAGIFRDGFFWLLDVDGNETFDSPPDLAFPFGGVPGDIPITGDWNGNGHTKVGVYRSSNGYFILDTNGDGVIDAGDAFFNLGVGMDPSDIPVVGDWNGTGTSKVGIFRAGFLWLLDYNGDQTYSGPPTDRAYFFGGVSGDLPVTGDWTGSGTSKIGIFRLGFYWLLDANGNGTYDGNGVGQDYAFPYGGVPQDLPVVGDWNGSGITKVGVFREGFFWVLDGNNPGDSTHSVGLAFAFGGISGDKPVVGKW
jgi:hypothetical protein